MITNTWKQDLTIAEYCTAKAKNFQVQHSRQSPFLWADLVPHLTQSSYSV